MQKVSIHIIPQLQGLCQSLEDLQGYSVSGYTDNRTEVSAHGLVTRATEQENLSSRLFSSQELLGFLLIDRFCCSLRDS